MTLALALYQPDIAQNTGTLLRLGACLGVPIHIIHPTGFPLTRQALKRGGLDYVDSATMREHDSFPAFEIWRQEAGFRLVLLTTKAGLAAYDFVYSAQDMLMVGRESAGVPDAVAASVDARIRIPMRPGLRSINVALSAAMVVGEAMRQTGGFSSLS